MQERPAFKQPPPWHKAPPPQQPLRKAPPQSQQLRFKAPPPGAFPLDFADRAFDHGAPAPIAINLDERLITAAGEIPSPRPQQWMGWEWYNIYIVLWTYLARIDQLDAFPGGLPTAITPLGRLMWTRSMLRVAEAAKENFLDPNLVVFPQNEY